MIIEKETLQYFANKGINVRYYPEKTFAAFKQRVYNEAVNSYIDYYKDTVDGCESVLNGRSNVLFPNMEALKNRAIESANIEVVKYGRGLESYNYETLYIDYNGRTIVKRIKTKSKEIDVDYINKEITKSEKLYNGLYGKFAEKVQALLRKNDIKDNLVIYPTTYGIGVWCIFNWGAEKDIKLVTDILNRNQIEYTNEYSDAFWVYRFKISKKHANISKLN